MKLAVDDDAAAPVVGDSADNRPSLPLFTDPPWMDGRRAVVGRNRDAHIVQGNVECTPSCWSRCAFQGVPLLEVLLGVNDGVMCSYRRLRLIREHELLDVSVIPCAPGCHTLDGRWVHEGVLAHQEGICLQFFAPFAT